VLTACVRFVGVDLAWSEREPCNETGVAALEPSGRIVAAGWCRGVAEVVDWLTEWARPDTLAFVDASLLVTNPTGQRPCETEVARHYGRWKVAANATNLATPHQAGATLKRRLEALGWAYDDGLAGAPTAGRRFSESFPYTTLVGVPELGYDRERPRYKRQPRGMRAAEYRPLRAAVCDDLIARVAALAEADPPLQLDSHPVTEQLLAEPSPLADAAYKHREDLLDAVLCAWTASLWVRHGLARCQVLGPAGPSPAATMIAPARPEQRCQGHPIPALC
jgi:predicted RNase H-like nuclease